MKILLISEFFPTGKDLKFSGGVEARNYYVAKYLANKNKVVVLTSRIKGSAKKENLANFQVQRVGSQRSYKASFGDIVTRLYFIVAAIKVGKTLKPDIVEGTNFITHFIAKVISINLKIPSVYWYPDVWIGSWIKNVGIGGVLGEILERINLFLGADAYIAISKSTAKKLQPRTKHKKIFVIGCGVDISEFKKRESKFEKFTIISVSRLADYKNIKDLLLAYAILKRKFRELRLIIVGRGPQETYLKKMALQLKLKGISFTSNLPRKKLNSLLKKSHLFCLPSSVEGFGIASIEAAAAGIPYVISDIETFKEVTGNGKGGLIFKVRNIYDLTEKLEKLITDKKLYALKTKEGIAYSQNYSWAKISSQTQMVYMRLIKENKSE